MGHKGTQWDTRRHNGIPYLSLRIGGDSLEYSTLGHDGIQCDTRHFILGTGGNTLGYSTLGHDGTRWDTLGQDKIWDTNLGHKIRDTKFGARSLEQKSWDTELGTQNGRQGDMTPYLGLELGDTLGYSTLGHVETRWDTKGKMGHDGIQWDTRHIILGTGGNKLGYSTLGHVGT